MNQDKHNFPFMIGIPSLLVIFAALCLTVFSILTVSTADAERRLSNVSADAVAAYYEADSEAERIFSELRLGEVPECVVVDGDSYAYTCPISGSLFLQVTLHRMGNDWIVLQWQAVSVNQ